MIASRGFRLSALFAVLLALFSLAAVDTAEARSGGSFGSRGMRTYQTVPGTSTIPGVTAPLQRSSTVNSTAARAGYGTNYARPSLFGGLGGWLVGGLLFSGLFGLMFGGGFGGIGGVFSLLIQLVVLYFVVRWLFRRFAGGRAATAGYGNNGYSYSAGPGYQPSPGTSGGYGAAPASGRAGGRDEIGIGRADLEIFERRLSQLQDAYSREDFAALRRIATPEVVSYLNEELAQSAAKGLRNEVYDVKLLSGDIAEAWREADADYATVALRYESRDVMRERATGNIVSGDESISTKSEVWTFARQRGGEWLLSAIQGA